MARVPTFTLICFGFASSRFGIRYKYQRLVRSAHTAACTSSGRLFVSPNVSYQDFGG
jgi:hypothetical protein